jgi:hypothetical protein
VKKNDSSDEQASQKKDSFDFPDGGWECNKCQNYNFKGRKQCFRCKKNKSSDDFEGKPEHMLKSKTQKVTNKKQFKGDDEFGNENSSTDYNR